MVSFMLVAASSVSRAHGSTGALADAFAQRLLRWALWSDSCWLHCQHADALGSRRVTVRGTCERLAHAGALNAFALFDCALSSTNAPDWPWQRLLHSGGLRRLLLCQLVSAASVQPPQPAVGVSMQPPVHLPSSRDEPNEYWPMHRGAGSLLMASGSDRACFALSRRSVLQRMSIAPVIMSWQAHSSSHWSPSSVAQITSKSPACSCCTGAICKPCQSCWSAAAA